MFLFILLPCSYDEIAFKFKYIPCFYLSNVNLCACFIFNHSNTSHVFIYLLARSLICFILFNSNTSHVFIYRIGGSDASAIVGNSNTSHVFIYRKIICFNSFFYKIQIHPMFLFITVNSAKASTRSSIQIHPMFLFILENLKML